jgi:uncharacterized membrane protein
MANKYRKQPFYLDAVDTKSKKQPVSIKLISDEIQQQVINRLKQSTEFESFFLVKELESASVREVFGIQKWLGYSESEFSLDTLRYITHPAHYLTITIHESIIFEMGLTGRFNKAFIPDLYFVTYLNMRHRSGHHLLLKKIWYPFQYDGNGRLLEELNYFTVIDIYSNKPFELLGLSPRVYHYNGQPAKLEREIKDKAKELFVKGKYFSKKEMEILLVYADNKQVTIKVLSQKLGVAESSIATFHKRILSKAQALFHVKFDSVKNVTLFLLKQGLL